MSDPTRKREVVINWRKRLINLFSPEPIEQIVADEMSQNFDKKAVDDALKELVRGAKEIRNAAQSVQKVSDDFVALTAKLVVRDMKRVEERTHGTKASSRGKPTK